MMKLRAAKGEGALALDEIDGHAGGLIALGGRAMLNGARFGVGGLVDRLVGVFGRGHTYLELQRHLLRDEEADNHALRDLARRVPRAARRHQRRPLRRARRSAALRRAHLHPPQDDAGGRRGGG